MKPHLHVAVGVVHNANGEILLSQRAPDKHQGGKWEFAGGKVEPGEQVEQALVREFDEELGIRPTHIHPLIQIPFEYAEHTVLLDVWHIYAFDGKLHAREQQAIQWVPKTQLREFEFPPANHAIIRAIELPKVYFITSDGDFTIPEDFDFVRVRQGSLSDDAYRKRIDSVLTLNKRVMVDAAFANEYPDVAGYHLTSQDLYHYQNFERQSHQLLAASTHNEAEIELANKLGVDFSVLSPVKHTASHPDANPIGWEKFAALVKFAQHPVYALGGMTRGDVKTAIQWGGQGVAGVSQFY